MKPVIKNIKIQEAIEYEKKYRVASLDVVSGTKVYKDSNVDQVVMNILWGYVSSLFEISEFSEVNIDLDLTYKTIKNLPFVAAYEFSVGKNPGSGYTIEENIEIAEKSIAAYLILLALNEHNVKLTIPVPKEMDDKRIVSPVFWSGFEVLIYNSLVKADFLKSIHGDVEYSSNKLIIKLDKVLSSYKMVTGEDLKKLGVDSIEAKL